MIQKVFKTSAIHLAVAKPKQGYADMKIKVILVMVENNPNG